MAVPKTQLQIVNSLQRRLRETVTASVNTNSYSRLLGQFVNDAIGFLNDQWFWSMYEQTITVSITGDGTRTFVPLYTVDYVASPLTITETTLHEQSFLIRKANEDRTPLAYDTTSGEEAQLYDIPYRELFEKRNSGTLEDIAQPTTFALKRQSALNSTGYPHWQIELLQGSTSARTWTMHWYVPQLDLTLDGVEDNTYVMLPYRAVYLLALYYALNERGEEMGEPGNVAERNAAEAMAAAIEVDMQVSKYQSLNDMTNLEMFRNRLLGDI